MDDDAPLPGADSDGLRAALFDIAERVRHPNLGLGYFVTEVPDDSKGDFDPDDSDALPDTEREHARLRRAALLLAALNIVDRCIDDLQAIEFRDNGLPDEDDADASFVGQWFPPRHRAVYNGQFYRKVMITAVKVAGDLADPRAEYASCTAEEIIRHVVGAIAGDLCEMAGLGRPWIHPDELLLEDTDFEELFSEDMDGLEDDPAMQAGLGLDVPPVSDWFTPFNDSRIVHPYAETASSAHSLHDLRQRLTGQDGPSTVLVSDVVDAATPIASFAAASEVVALARQAARGDAAGRWVADDTDRERSFAALADVAATSERGSGWLDWEPYEGADTIRSEPVVQLTPHRHFPVGDDEPWVDAAIGGARMLAIPLRVVISYRPDPEVRRRWNQAFSEQV